MYSYARYAYVDQALIPDFISAWVLPQGAQPRLSLLVDASIWSMALRRDSPSS
jgi:hypothetical protein